MIAPANDLLEAFEWAFASGVPKSKRNVTPPGDPELGAKNVGMSLRCSRRDAQALRDLEVRTSFRDELDHLALAGSELLLVGHGGSDVGSRGRLCLLTGWPILMDYTLRSTNDEVWPCAFIASTDLPSKAGTRSNSSSSSLR
jgi:hypothetical protein